MHCIDEKRLTIILNKQCHYSWRITHWEAVECSSKIYSILLAFQQTSIKCLTWLYNFYNRKHKKGVYL